MIVDIIKGTLAHCPTEFYFYGFLLKLVEQFWSTSRTLLFKFVKILGIMK